MRNSAFSRAPECETLAKRTPQNAKSIGVRETQNIIFVLVIMVLRAPKFMTHSPFFAGVAIVQIGIYQTMHTHLALLKARGRRLTLCPRLIIRIESSTSVDTPQRVELVP